MVWGLGREGACERWRKREMGREREERRERGREHGIGLSIPCIACRV